MSRGLLVLVLVLFVSSAINPPVFAESACDSLVTFPIIQSILDVGNDGGKQVRITWCASSQDTAGDTTVFEYLIYRRIDSLPSRPNLLTSEPGEWDFVRSVAAVDESLYNVVVPTLKNCQGTNPAFFYTAFFIRAANHDRTIFFDSPVDSGCSRDNIPPSPPETLIAVGTCQGNRLFYSRNLEPDFNYFKIYRDSLPGFATPILVGTTGDTFFVDAAPVNKTFYYRISAVDLSNNESGLSPQANALAGLKGDLNGDGNLGPADVVLELNAIFLGMPFPAPFCAADTDCDGFLLNPSDVVLLLNAVFLNTPITCSP